MSLKVLFQMRIQDLVKGGGVAASETKSCWHSKAESYLRALEAFGFLKIK